MESNTWLLVDEQFLFFDISVVQCAHWWDIKLNTWKEFPYLQPTISDHFQKFYEDFTKFWWPDERFRTIMTIVLFEFSSASPKWQWSPALSLIQGLLPNVPVNAGFLINLFYIKKDEIKKRLSWYTWMKASSKYNKFKPQPAVAAVQLGV